MSFAIYLPYPPSLNTMWTHNHKPSKHYTAWKAEADRFLECQMAEGLKLPIKPWSERYTLESRLNPPNAIKRDLDNVGAKAFSDRLKAWAIIVDDSQAEKITMLWDRENLTPGTAFLTVTKLPA